MGLGSPTELTWSGLNPLVESLLSASELCPRLMAALTQGTAPTWAHRIQNGGELGALPALAWRGAAGLRAQVPAATRSRAEAVPLEPRELWIQCCTLYLVLSATGARPLVP